MTKDELLHKLWTKVNDESRPDFRRNLSRKDCQAFLDALGRVVLSALCHGESVTLPGLGTLYVKKRNSRSGRNPKTGQPLIIPACVVPDFKPTADLKQSVKISNLVS